MNLTIVNSKFNIHDIHYSCLKTMGEWGGGGGATGMKPHEVRRQKQGMQISWQWVEHGKLHSDPLGVQN